MHHLTWGWDETTDALRWTSPFVSVALFAIGIVRYFRDDMSSQSRRSVRRSIAAYAIHLLVTVVPFIDSRMAHSVLSDIFVWASLLRLPVLIASIYFGFRSRATAGRRIAFAGISAMALPWVYGGRITARQDYSNVWPPI